MKSLCVALGVLIGVVIGFVVCNWAWDVMMQAKGIALK